MLPAGGSSLAAAGQRVCASVRRGRPSRLLRHEGVRVPADSSGPRRGAPLRLRLRLLGLGARRRRRCCLASSSRARPGAPRSSSSPARAAAAAAAQVGGLPRAQPLLLRRAADAGPAQRRLPPHARPHPPHQRPLLRLRVSRSGGPQGLLGSKCRAVPIGGGGEVRARDRSPTAQASPAAPTRRCRRYSGK